MTVNRRPPEDRPAPPPRTGLAAAGLGPQTHGQPTPGAGASATRTCPCRLAIDAFDAFDAAPFVGQHEQRPSTGAPEHARKAGSVEREPLQYLAPFADPYDFTLGISVAAGVRTGARRLSPDCALRVEADPVRADAVGPDTPVRQAAVAGDVERGQATGEGLSNDQRRVVRRDDHPVRELDTVRHLSRRAVGRDQRDDPRLGRLAAQEVEAEPVDVDVAAAVDDDLVPAVVGHLARVGMSHRGPVGLATRELRAGHEEAAVGQPVDGPPETGRALSDDLAVAVQVDRDDLTRAPMREPQPALVPAGGFDIRETAQQDSRFMFIRRGHAGLLEIGRGGTPAPRN